MLTDINKNHPSFNGYDGRRIASLVMSANYGNIPQELTYIGEKVGFDVKLLSGGQLIDPRNLDRFQYTRDISAWAQDIATVTPDKKNVIAQISTNGLARTLSKVFDIKAKYKRTDNISGGNLFYIKNELGKEELLVGKNSVSCLTPKTLAEYGVDEFHTIPQMDFHIDLAVRPLENKTILVTDDNMTEAVLQKGIESIERYSKDEKPNILTKIKLYFIKDRLQVALKNFQQSVKDNIWAKTDEAVLELKKAGFQPVKVLGRLYNSIADDLFNEINYMNAIVTKDSDGKLVYITNKSRFDDRIGITPKVSEKIRFSFEQEFVNSISGYVPKENIYFVKGEGYSLADTLQEKWGGIHCMVAEIPA